MPDSTAEKWSYLEYIIVIGYLVAGRVLCGHCGSIFGRKVLNFTDE